MLGPPAEHGDDAGDGAGAPGRTWSRPRSRGRSRSRSRPRNRRGKRRHPARGATFVAAHRDLADPALPAKKGVAHPLFGAVESHDVRVGLHRSTPVRRGVRAFRRFPQSRTTAPSGTRAQASAKASRGESKSEADPVGRTGTAIRQTSSAMIIAGRERAGRRDGVQGSGKRGRLRERESRRRATHRDRPGTRLPARCPNVPLASASLVSSARTVHAGRPRATRWRAGRRGGRRNRPRGPVTAFIPGWGIPWEIACTVELESGLHQTPGTARRRDFRESRPCSPTIPSPSSRRSYHLRP